MTRPDPKPAAGETTLRDPDRGMIVDLARKHGTRFADARDAVLAAFAAVVPQATEAVESDGQIVVQRKKGAALRGAKLDPWLDTAFDHARSALAAGVEEEDEEDDEDDDLDLDLDEDEDDE